MQPSAAVCALWEKVTKCNMGLNIVKTLPVCVCVCVRECVSVSQVLVCGLKMIVGLLLHRMLIHVSLLSQSQSMNL